MTFKTQTLVRFAHIDAAGIVFYPRYFEMLNGAIEDWFDAIAGVTFADMHIARRVGIPTVKLEAEFVAPSRLGDLLDITVVVEKVGTSSATLVVEFACAGELRLRSSIVLVCIDLDTGRPRPWPDDMRPPLSRVAA
jgi:4-hydroxybenzoyl-CoA thioesterase